MASRTQPKEQNVILDSISEGVFTVDMDWRITPFNRAAEEITGIEREKAVGRQCRDVLRADLCQYTPLNPDVEFLWGRAFILFCCLVQFRRFFFLLSRPSPLIWSQTRASGVAASRRCIRGEGKIAYSV
jgi:PAS domain-containing protein